MISSELIQMETILKSLLEEFQEGSTFVLDGRPLTDQKLNKRRYYYVEIGESIDFTETMLDEYLSITLNVNAVSRQKTQRKAKYDVLDMLFYAVQLIIQRECFQHIPTVSDIQVVDFNGVSSFDTVDNFKSYQCTGSVSFQFKLKLVDGCLI